MCDYNLIVFGKDDSRLLARVAGLIARLGLSLKTMSLVSSTEGGTCRMSFVVSADPVASDLLRRMLSRLVDIERVEVRAFSVKPIRKNVSFQANALVAAVLPQNA